MMLSWDFLSPRNLICMFESEAEGFGGFKLKGCGIIPLDEVGYRGWGHIGVPRPRLRKNDNFAHPDLTGSECTPDGTRHRAVEAIVLHPFVNVSLRHSYSHNPPPPVV